MITLSTGPDWASIVTAIGTVLVAIVAVGIALWSEWRTGKRLADERAFSRAQIEEERRIARNGEQFSEAYAVQVVLGERSTGEPGERSASASRLGAIVINHGRYAITGIEAQLRLGSSNPSLVSFTGRERVPGTKDLDAGLRNRRTCPGAGHRPG